jgi:GNAT superfamily N-acetyltransferase
MNNVIRIQKENPHSSYARMLLAELTADIAKRYDFLMDGKGGFSPDEVAMENAGFYVVYINHKPAACCALRPLYKNEIAEVKRMYVRPGFRGLGLAKQMLKELESAALKFGYNKIWLETGDRQPEAIQLYTNAGYSRISNYGDYKENLHSNCFEKIL